MHVHASRVQVHTLFSLVPSGWRSVHVHARAYASCSETPLPPSTIRIMCDRIATVLGLTALCGQTPRGHSPRAPVRRGVGTPHGRPPLPAAGHSPRARPQGASPPEGLPLRHTSGSLPDMCVAVCSAPALPPTKDAAQDLCDDAPPGRRQVARPSAAAAAFGACPLSVSATDSSDFGVSPTTCLVPTDYVENFVF